LRLSRREGPRGGARPLAVRRGGRRPRRLPALGEGRPQGGGRRDAPRRRQAVDRKPEADADRLAPPDVCRPGAAPGPQRPAPAHAALTRFAGRAFRRPAAESEIAPFLAVFDAARAEPGRDESRPDKAVQEALKAVLVSPKFLYRLETARGSHQPYRVSDHELA